mmetsp:Transcript_34044/g.108263  ORF Transcript_34044/g.108263 Transcript_34044/m.108263 type:complete len:229 (+) Transcript_34044:470-1156(+)
MMMSGRLTVCAVKTKPMAVRERTTPVREPRISGRRPRRSTSRKLTTTPSICAEARTTVKATSRLLSSEKQYICTVSEALFSFMTCMGCARDTRLSLAARLSVPPPACFSTEAPKYMMVLMPLHCCRKDRPQPSSRALRIRRSAKRRLSQDWLAPPGPDPLPPASDCTPCSMSRYSCSTASASAPARRAMSTPLASSHRPLLMSQRGDSRLMAKPTNIRLDGTAAHPSM